MLIFLLTWEEEKPSLSLPFSDLPAPYRPPTCPEAFFQHSSALGLPLGRKQLLPKPPGHLSQLALSFSLIPRVPQGQGEEEAEGSSLCGPVGCG